MLEIIKEKLKEIEENENVRIIHCVESGSRAWGFASPDSDYDVRFIYVRPKEYYLRLDKTRDVIEWQLDETLDINGWDIKKALGLLHKSNPTVFEWNSSPIVYKTTDEWEKVSSLVGKYFSRKSGVYHYLSTAKGNYFKYFKGDQVRIKKYFYVLRPLLACRWILAEGTPPPVLFDELMEKHLDESIRQDMEGLLEMKKTTSELGVRGRIDRINEYIDRSIEEIEYATERLRDTPSQGWDELNELFLGLV